MAGALANPQFWKIKATVERGAKDEGSRCGASDHAIVGD
jgi:hypothetical protein